MVSFLPTHAVSGHKSVSTNRICNAYFWKKPGADECYVNQY